MDTLLILTVSVTAVWWLWRTMQRTHRRSQRLSRLPWGLDTEGDRDIARTLAEIDAIRSREEVGHPR